MKRREPEGPRPTLTPCEASLELCQNEAGRLRSQIECLKATIKRLRAELRAERARR